MAPSAPAPSSALKHLGLALGAAAAAVGSVLFIAWKVYFRDAHDSCIGWQARWERQLADELRGRRRKTPRDPEEEEEEEEEDHQPHSCEHQVLVLGLDGAGKSSIIHYVCNTEAQKHIAPTQGFNSAQLQVNGLQLDLLEVGGSQNLRFYWNHYLSKAHVLVFVVDSADGSRLHTARQELHCLLSQGPQLPLIVLANKQDKCDAMSVSELKKELGLHTLNSQREFFLLPTSATDTGLDTANSVLHLKSLLLKILAQI